MTRKDQVLINRVEELVGQTLTSNQKQIVAANQEFRELVENVWLARSSFVQQLVDPRRDIDAECGYPDPSQLNADFFQYLYERESTAARVVELYPLECWKLRPWVYETEDPEDLTPFEESWVNLTNNLRGQSWYKQEYGNPLWDYLKRADIQCGIGHYGVMLLGLNDKRKLSTRAAGIDEQGQKTGEGTGTKLNFLRVFPETQAQILEIESNPGNPRFGLPTKYRLNFFRPKDWNASLSQTYSSESEVVHWSRILHFNSEQKASSEILSVPRLRDVVTKVLNLIKLYGGSAEMYWKGAFPGLSIESHPQVGGNPRANTTTLRDQLYRYQNGLQRMLVLLGLSVKSIAPQVVDPTPQIEVQIEGICIRLACPKRIFKGSERGEMASSQDDATWDERVDESRVGHRLPNIVVPTLDRFIALGVLAEPGEKGYVAEWPDIKSIGLEALAKIGMIRMQTISNYLQAGGSALISPLDFLVHEMGYTEKRAVMILKRAVKELQKANPDIPPNKIVAGKQPPMDMGLGFDSKGNPIMPVSGTRPPAIPKGRDNNRNGRATQQPKVGRIG